MKTVKDLSREELAELKENFFWQDETQDILEDITCPEDIPNEVVFEHYDGVVFSEDDFFCNIEKEDK